MRKKEADCQGTATTHQSCRGRGCPSHKAETMSSNSQLPSEDLELHRCCQVSQKQSNVCLATVYQENMWLTGSSRSLSVSFIHRRKGKLLLAALRRQRKEKDCQGENLNLQPQKPPKVKIWTKSCKLFQCSALVWPTLLNNAVFLSILLSGSCFLVILTKY